MDLTKLVYMEDFSLMTLSAKIVGIEQENGRDLLYLDQTIFYPQGGGQPWDTGFIKNASFFLPSWSSDKLVA